MSKATKPRPYKPLDPSTDNPSKLLDLRREWEAKLKKAGLPPEPLPMRRPRRRPRKLPNPPKSR